MSKSLGNGVDPLDVIERYGADAMRFMLSTGSTAGQDVRFQWERVEAARNFANKIWNASRFSLMNLAGVTAADLQDIDNLDLALPDRWIIHRFNETVSEVTRLLDTHEFGEAGRHLYNFIWDDFCDWYIELAKLPLYGDDAAAKRRTQSVLCYVLDRTLRLLHPFMPFITEEIWQHLPHDGESIAVAEWPKAYAGREDASAVKDMTLLIDVIRAVRNIRSEVNVSPGKKIRMAVNAADDTALQTLSQYRTILERFCNTDSLELGTAFVPPEKAMSAVVTGAEIYLPMEGLIDIEQELSRLEKELALYQSEVERVQKKLNNPQFVAKAPAHVVEDERCKERDYIDKREKVMARIEELKRL
jgi:valyl-tRNA synthetase